MKKKYAPVALFVYNRPIHAQMVLDKLTNCNGFRDTDVYIFSDGSKNSRDVASVEETRQRIKVFASAHGNIRVIESEYNKGLADSIVSGVDYILGRSEQIIILEDDCVPSSDFLDFMLKCLIKYKDENRIMSLSGYALPIRLPPDYPYDIYYTYRSTSWGWGTWGRAWKYFNRSGNLLDEIKKSRTLKEKINRIGADLIPMLEMHAKGQIDSWSVFWSIAIIKNNGLCVNPTKSRIENIGFDGTGVHCGKSGKFKVGISSSDKEIVFPEEVKVENFIIRQYGKFFGSGIKGKVTNFIRRAPCLFVMLKRLLLLFGTNRRWNDGYSNDKHHV
ncbi:MAG: glycosyltransferase family A protein [Bacillota bacterium]